jgi:serine/threonine protein kinase/Flp pilus assembly protein TadD
VINHREDRRIISYFSGIASVAQPVPQEACSVIGSRISHYAILSKIGSGGMGDVYLARDTDLDREVALKLISPKLASDKHALERLQREAKVLASLSHPNIVTIYTVERSETQQFLTMELVRGTQLGALIPEQGFSCERFLEFALPLTDAVSAAHEKGIVHRDLNPANVMITETGKVKVLDFGLARPLEEGRGADPAKETAELISEDLVVGTAPYASPEQIRGTPVDARSDVFSLGVMLFEMLTGERPFQSGSLADVISSILTDDPPILSTMRPDLPRHLARVIDECLEKDPALRHGSATQLREGLERVKVVTGLNHHERHPSIAVLPFADMSSDQDQAYFCEGIAEEIINALSHIKNMQIASRTSSFLYRNNPTDIREIGRRLNVSCVLEGSVRKSGETVRVTAQLINVTNGYHLWSANYDRRIEDIFAIQDEISQSIAQALQVTLSSGEEYRLRASHTSNVEAYDYYLRGRKAFFEQRRKGIDLGLQMFSLAIKYDPGYALAHAGISVCHSYLYMIGEPSEEHLRLADAASQKALQLSPELAESHVSRGLALSTAKRHAEAELAFETAVRLDARLFDAYYFHARDAAARGDLEKSCALFERASEVCPEDYQAPLLGAQAHSSLGREAAATAARRQGLHVVERVLEINPGDVRALYLGANALVALGERQKASEWASLAISMDPDESMVLYNVACIYAKLGELEESMNCLERAVDAGLTLKGWIVNDSDLEPIRGHRRYGPLIKKLDELGG